MIYDVKEKTLLHHGIVHCLHCVLYDSRTCAHLITILQRFLAFHIQIKRTQKLNKKEKTTFWTLKDSDQVSKSATQNYFSQTRLFSSKNLPPEICRTVELSLINYHTEQVQAMWVFSFCDFLYSPRWNIKCLSCVSFCNSQSIFLRDSYARFFIAKEKLRSIFRRL